MLPSQSGSYFTVALSGKILKSVGATERFVILMCLLLFELNCLTFGRFYFLMYSGSSNLYECGNDAPQFACFSILPP